jgi:hypothetical protein
MFNILHHVINAISRDVFYSDKIQGSKKRSTANRNGRSVSIVTTLRTGQPGIDSSQEKGIYPFVTASRLVPKRAWGSAPGYKSTKLTTRLHIVLMSKLWSYTSTYPYVVMMW